MPLPWQLPLAGVPTLLMLPNAVDSRPLALALRGDGIETPSGARMTDTAPARPNTRHQFEFVCTSRAELTFLTDFFDAQQGMAGAFFFPTWQREFSIYGYTEFATDDTRLLVAATGYPASVFPLGSAFRQLLLVQGALWKFHTITAAAASGTPGLDVLSMSNPSFGNSSPAVPFVTGPLAVPDDSYWPLSLRYGRFDQDELVAEVITADGAAVVTLSLVELAEDIPI